MTIAEDTPELRKARGAFFTPPKSARYVCEWAVRSPTDVVYEPSCGEADFLLAAGRRLAELEADNVDGGGNAAGAEMHEASARAALAELHSAGMSAEIDVADFFDVELCDGSYDAVVGNPPYVRYQAFHGEARAKAQQAALRAGVRLSGLASSWAAFTVRSAQLTKPDGRLRTGSPCRASLDELRRSGPPVPGRSGSASVRLIMFDERVFPDVKQLAEVVFLLDKAMGAERRRQGAQALKRWRLLWLTPRSPIGAPLIPEAKWTLGIARQRIGSGLCRWASCATIRSPSWDAWGRTRAQAWSPAITASSRLLAAEEVVALGLQRNPS